MKGDSGAPELPGTERLRLRRFTGDDLPFLFSFYSDPEIARFIGGVKTLEETSQLLETRILAYYDAHPGLGVWMMSTQDGAMPVGFALLNNLQGESLIQVGYSVARAHWNRGYATEICTALLRYGYAELHLPNIVAITNRENLVSQHVLEKAGLRCNGERAFAHPAYAAAGAVPFFERDAASWLAEDVAKRRVA